MYKLTICHANGHECWVEYFNDMASAIQWLETEKTRPYWEADRTYKIEEV